MLTATEIYQRLVDAGVLLKGHFVLASRKHSDTFVDFEAMFKRENAGTLNLIAEQMARASIPPEYDFVIGPAVGGDKLAGEITQQLLRMGHRQISQIPTRKVEGKILIDEIDLARLRRKRIRLVDDVITTGGTLIELVPVITGAGGVIHSVACCWNRGKVTAPALGIPLLQSLLEIEIQTWDNRELCPLCQADVPVDPINSHGRLFIAQEQSASRDAR